LEPGEPQRLAAFLDACWAAFDTALAGVPAGERPLKPETGRAPETMRVHLAGALRAYLAWVDVPRPLPRWNDEVDDDLEGRLRDLMRGAVRALPEGVPFTDEKRPGPYTVRRECWHALDHAWELEDRLTAQQSG
jgi:hypothetical protein